jgi:hypothetical protein
LIYRAGREACPGYFWSLRELRAALAIVLEFFNRRIIGKD